ncbi:hypothetical protein [Nocardia wallacei]|uniref:hypothetical protein n=1 Tax=Nocardia wallacei TaxID=480035 RepID=UPI0024562E89|nr:hypothetical protein [Nocardia wallacei]
MGADTGRSNRPADTGSGPAQLPGFGPPLGPPDWLMQDIPSQQPELTWQPGDAPASPPAAAAPQIPTPEWALDPDVVQRTLAPPARKSRRVPGRLRVVVAVALVACGVAVGAIVARGGGGPRAALHGGGVGALRAEMGAPPRPRGRPGDGEVPHRHR